MMLMLASCWVRVSPLSYQWEMAVAIIIEYMVQSRPFHFMSMKYRKTCLDICFSSKSPPKTANRPMAMSSDHKTQGCFSLSKVLLDSRIANARDTKNTEKYRETTHRKSFRKKCDHKHSSIVSTTRLSKISGVCASAASTKASSTSREARPDTGTRRVVTLTKGSSGRGLLFLPPPPPPSPPQHRRRQWPRSRTRRARCSSSAALRNWVKSRPLPQWRACT
mmetsp:Transcript_39747/g.58459  ORF Transcript_39747/g.58459 Transcript_39747/m.58459 type:complete len:221 (-) Transcript_39747:160-822(-)